MPRHRSKSRRARKSRRCRKTRRMRRMNGGSKCRRCGSTCVSSSRTFNGRTKNGASYDDECPTCHVESCS